LRLFDILPDIAQSNASVLIQGESGTGKELVARAIHNLSFRKDKGLVVVNCGALPDTLLESELFGYVRGAFTDAKQDKPGRFQLADQGTLFLDEIGDISPAMQVKLLRVLQEGEYERLGEEKTRKVDVRVIAATNRNLKKEVNNKNFRDDLFYRLNVFPIHISPLKDRTDDIPLLASHFIEKLAKDMNLHKPELTKANIFDLQAYRWPGNVRELENTIERAMILSSSSKKLNFSSILDTDDAHLISDRTAEQVSNTDAILSEADLRELERENMIRALRHCNWKIYRADGAAQLLGIKPTTLIERMKRMNIRKPR
jgi:transcriptional regulator with GAF, ATPase, and Fis domain